MTDRYDFYGLGARLGGQPAALADADWDRGGIDQYEFAMACLLSPGVPLTQGGLTWQVWNMALSDYRGDLGKACVACAEASEESRGRAGKTEADDGPSTGCHDTSPASPVASQAQSATSLLISSALLNGDPCLRMSSDNWEEGPSASQRRTRQAICFLTSEMMPAMW